MRRLTLTPFHNIKLYIVLALSVFLFVGVSHSDSEEVETNTYPNTCDNKSSKEHLDRTREIWGNAYALKRWRDKTPAKRIEINRVHKHKRCLLKAEHKDRVENQRSVAKTRFLKHRRKKLFQKRWLPYYFGEPTIKRVAIPPYIVRCETRGYYGERRWYAANGSSGARGPYQMLPSTYYSVSNKDNWRRRDQHKVARKIMERYGPSQWECA